MVGKYSKCIILARLCKFHEYRQKCKNKSSKITFCNIELHYNNKKCWCHKIHKIVEISSHKNIDFPSTLSLVWECIWTWHLIAYICPILRLDVMSHAVGCVHLWPEILLLSQCPCWISLWCWWKPVLKWFDKSMLLPYNYKVKMPHVQYRRYNSRYYMYFFFNPFPSETNIPDYYVLGYLYPIQLHTTDVSLFLHIGSNYYFYPSKICKTWIEIRGITHKR